MYIGAEGSGIAVDGHALSGSSGRAKIQNLQALVIVRPGIASSGSRYEWLLKLYIYRGNLLAILTCSGLAAKNSFLRARKYRGLDLSTLLPAETTRLQ